MAVLEVLLLHPHPTNPPTSPEFLAELRRVRSLVRTGARFFISVSQSRDTASSFSEPKTDPAVFILGEWPSLAAHKRFLASEWQKEVLGQQAEMARLGWWRHAKLPEPKGFKWEDTADDADFGDGLGEAMCTSVPVNAKVLCIARLTVKMSQVGEFEHAWRRFRLQLKDIYTILGHSGQRIIGERFGGWTVDDLQSIEKIDYLAVLGWDDAEDAWLWREERSSGGKYSWEHLVQCCVPGEAEMYFVEDLEKLAGG